MLCKDSEKRRDKKEKACTHLGCGPKTCIGNGIPANYFPTNTLGVIPVTPLKSRVK